MPEISRFLGILITMYYNDHPPPHFHAKYGEFVAAIAINSGEVLDGRLSPRVLGLVQEWREQNKTELTDFKKTIETNRTIGVRACCHS